MDFYGCPFYRLLCSQMEICRLRPMHPRGKCPGQFDNFLGRKEMPNLGKLALIFLAAVVVLALTPTAGWGQNVYGSITGTVTDTSGAAISEATVTLTNLDKGEKRTIESDSSGNYTLVNILPEESLSIVRFSPLSRFVSVTVASLIAAPLVSVTVPVMLPYTFWPHPAVGVSAKTTTAAKKISASFPRFGISFLPKKLSNCPGHLQRPTATDFHLGIKQTIKRATVKSHNDHPV